MKESVFTPVSYSKDSSRSPFAVFLVAGLMAVSVPCESSSVPMSKPCWSGQSYYNEILNSDKTDIAFTYQPGDMEHDSDVDVLVEFDIIGKPLSSRRIKAIKVIKRDPYFAVAPDPEDFLTEAD